MNTNLSAILATDADAADVQFDRKPQLKRALEIQAEARVGLSKTQRAIALAKTRIAERKEELASLQKKLEALQSRVLLGEADESESDALVSQITAAKAKLDATVSGLDGIQKRLAVDDGALKRANLDVANAAATAARPHVEALRKGIESSLHEVFRQHAQLLRLGQSLGGLDSSGAVSFGVDPSSFATQDLTERIERAARELGLRRVRMGVDAFESAGYGGMGQAELLELLT